MRNRFLLLGLVTFSAAFAACTSEVPIGEGATTQNLGGEGQAPRADGTCAPGLTACGGTCTVRCGPAGLDAGPDGRDGGPPVTLRPAPQVLAAGRTLADGIAVDSNAVYWTERGARPIVVDQTGHGSVLKMPLNGGAPVTIASDQDGPAGIAVNATSVYWTNVGHFTNSVYSGGSVMKAPLSGGQPPTAIATDIETPVAIGLDASNVYFVGNGAGASFTPGKFGLFRASLSGAAAPEIVVPVGGLGAHHVGVDASNLVWSGHSVMRTDLQGMSSGPTPVIWSPSGDNSLPWDLAIHGTMAYSTTANTGKLFSYPIAGGTPTVLSDGHLGQGRGIATDAVHVYWVACILRDCSIQRVPLAGGVTETIATAQKDAFYLALDAGFVYWTTSDAILRAPK